MSKIGCNFIRERLERQILTAASQKSAVFLYYNGIDYARPDIKLNKDE
jgi:hypothetical protein